VAAGESSGHAFPAPARVSDGPAIAVVIPAHDAAGFVADAIDSVLVQTLPAAEIVVVDDGSEDDTAAILAPYAESGRIEVLTQPNLGVCMARNNGLARTRSPLVSFLDADDVWDPERNRIMADALTGDAIGAVSAFEVADAELRPLRIQPVGAMPTVQEALMNAAVPVSLSSNLMVRREALDAVGAFDPRLSTSADWELCLRLLDRGRLTTVERALTRYRRHDGGMSRSVELMEHDMTLIYDEVFGGSGPVTVDPRIRRPAYARLHRMLAGSYLQANRPGKAAVEMLRSIRFDRRELRYALATPVRRFGRRAGSVRG
jgi:glycosyltransferase involved in cell wall biosynthesis